MSKESNAYVLGTDPAELHRLGVQHQAWSTEANLAWRNAGFTAGMTLLDLGCGPGFCTQELAYIAGTSGHVIGVDRSQIYIDFLDQLSKQHHLGIEAICADFANMQLVPSSLDGVYTRWALAWLTDVGQVLDKVIEAMKPGATFAIHEYYDWSLLQTEPYREELFTATRACLQSFEDQGGDIDIGRRLPAILEEKGLTIMSIRPMTKQARPQDHEWNWPKTFLEIFIPKLVETGHLTSNHAALAVQQLYDLEKVPGATLQTPLMTEIIAKKV